MDGAKLFLSIRAQSSYNENLGLDFLCFFRMSEISSNNLK